MSDNFLTPEMVDKLMALSGNSDQERILEEQLAQAQALRNKQWPQYTVPLAAAIGGIGHIFDNVRGAMQEKDLRGQQQGFLAKDLELRRLYGHGLFSQEQAQGQARPQDLAPDVQPAQEMTADTQDGVPAGAPDSAATPQDQPDPSQVMGMPPLLAAADPRKEQQRRDFLSALFGPDPSKQPPEGY